MNRDKVPQALAALHGTQSQLDNLQKRKVELISFLRDVNRLDGWEPVSWEVIGRALGISRQAAWAAYSWLDDGVNDD